MPAHPFVVLCALAFAAALIGAAWQLERRRRLSGFESEITGAVALYDAAAPTAAPHHAGGGFDSGGTAGSHAGH